MAFLYSSFSLKAYWPHDVIPGSSNPCKRHFVPWKPTLIPHLFQSLSARKLIGHDDVISGSSNVQKGTLLRRSPHLFQSLSARKLIGHDDVISGSSNVQKGTLLRRSPHLFQSLSARKLIGHDDVISGSSNVGKRPWKPTLIPKCFCKDVKDLSITVYTHS
jgi:hypothetical protein